MDTKRLIVLGGIVVAIMIGMSFFSSTPKMKMEKGEPKSVVSVSTFSLYEIGNAVAGERLEIHSIIPLGTDAHMFSPNPKQVADIDNSALFIYNGAGFESWAEQLKNSLSKKTDIIDMSQYVHLIEGTAHHEEENSDEHDHGTVDPHYWLDIDNMINMTQVVDSEFSKRFPQDEALFHANAQAYIEKLQNLKREYAEGLKECKSRVLVSNHDAFGYLAHANNLQDVSVIGLSSDEQPSAKNIADIIAIVKEHQVKTIFFEEFINDNIAQTIAKEAGVNAKALQPLENISEDELKSHQTYLSIMQDNLAKLREALECD